MVKMNRTKLFLTKLMYKNPNRIYQHVKKLKLYDGTDIEIIVFSERNPLYLGQATIFNTIIIEESVFRRYNNDTQNYILTHEYAHTKQNLLSIIGFVSLIILLEYLIWGFQQHPFYFPYGLMFSLIGVGVFSLFSWILEIDADCYTIKHIGKDIFLNGKADLKIKAQKRSFFKKLIIQLTHPPLWVTIKIYELINNKYKSNFI